MVVLATKVYVRGDARERALRSLASLVDNAVGDLDVEWSVSVRDDDFPEVAVDGPDATAAGNVLREEWGEIPPQQGDGGPADGSGAPAVGTLESWDDAGFVLDAGRDVRVPPEGLGLGPGSPADVVERFGVVQHLRMRFVSGEPGVPDDEAGGPRLADAERDRLYDWTRGPGRVNVNSATRAEVRATVNRAGHASDVVTVERLGLLEQSIVCREGTDPPGLLAAIGDYLPAEMRCVIP